MSRGTQVLWDLEWVGGGGGPFVELRSSYRVGAMQPNGLGCMDVPASAWEFGDLLYDPNAAGLGAKQGDGSTWILLPQDGHWHRAVDLSIDVMDDSVVGRVGSDGERWSGVDWDLARRRGIPTIRISGRVHVEPDLRIWKLLDLDDDDDDDAGSSLPASQVVGKHVSVVMTGSDLACTACGAESGDAELLAEVDCSVK